ncbi:deaminase, partial [Vibrio cholerae]|nr:deaminase [Vibrio cholerae]
WEACTPVKNIIERLELEQQELPILAQTTGERAELLLRNILNAGSTHIRTHVNIDPYIGLKNLESVRQTLENMKDAFTYEIVAFPQHGLLRT